VSKQPNPFIRYSGLAFQMAAPIILGVLIGRYLDGEDALLYTIIFSLLGVFSGLYLALKDFL
jgi:uncharacterized membrane protein